MFPRQAEIKVWSRVYSSTITWAFMKHIHHVVPMELKGLGFSSLSWRETLATESVSLSSTRCWSWECPEGELWPVRKRYLYDGEVWRHINISCNGVPFFIHLNHLHCGNTGFITPSTAVVDHGYSWNNSGKVLYLALRLVTSSQSPSRSILM